MTDTMTAGHQQPCFCDGCWFASMDGLVHERAKLYDAAILDGRDSGDLARGLAEELIEGIPVASRAQVLEFMLTWEHLSPRVMGVDCLLDETDQRSYGTLTKLAEILLAAIHEQGCEGRALRILVENEICGRRKLVAFERQEHAALTPS